MASAKLHGRMSFTGDDVTLPRGVEVVMVLVVRGCGDELEQGSEGTITVSVEAAEVSTTLPSGLV